MEKTNKNKYIVNVTLLGESNVGKTTIKDRLLGRQFNLNMSTTVSPPYCESIIFNTPKIPDSDIIINIWDTAGQEKFRSSCKEAIRRADILLFVRDNIHNNIGGENSNDWLNIAEECTDLNSENVKKIFCLNKTDLMNDEEKNNNKELLSNIANNYNNRKVIVISSKNDNDIQNLKEDITIFSEELTLEAINAYKYEINAIVFGPSMVGKTALINRIIYDYFQESPVLETKVQKSSKQISLKYICHIDLKTNYDIKINYYDIPGQNQYMEKNLHILRKADIIIFVNDNDDLEINDKIIKTKISLKGKKIIFCINKSDLFLKKIKNIEKDFRKKNNEKIKENKIFIVSAKDGNGIKELKEYVSELANDIIEKRNQDKNESDKETSVGRQLRGVKILNKDDIPEVEAKKEKFCKDCLKAIFNLNK